MTLADYTEVAESAIRKPLLERNQGHDDSKGDQSQLPPTRETATKFKVRGIPNLGQTCFLTAAIHLARACEPFREALLQSPFPDQQVPADSDSADLSIATALRAAIMGVEDVKAQGSFEPDHLASTLEEVKGWDVNTQQDVTEIWLTFKEALHTCTNKAAREIYIYTYQYPATDNISPSANGNWASMLEHQSDSCGDRPFLGQTVIERICGSCKTAKPRTFATFGLLEVPMPPDVRSNTFGTTLSLSRLLDIKYQPTTVDAECDPCESMESFTESQMLTHLPDYPMLSLSRFEGTTTKIRDQVSFQVDGLNIHKFVLLEMRGDQSHLYDCRAVIHHRGDDLRAGHYVAYVRESLRDEESQQWILCHDEVMSFA